MGAPGGNVERDRHKRRKDISQIYENIALKQLTERIGMIRSVFVCGYPHPLALPLGELSPQVTERVLRFPSPASFRSATSPKGRGKEIYAAPPECV